MIKRKKIIYMAIGICVLLTITSSIFIGFHMYKRKIEGNTGMFFLMAVGRTTGCTLVLNGDTTIMKGKNDWGELDVTWIDSYETKDIFTLENDTITMMMYPVEYIPKHESSIKANKKFTPTPILCEIRLEASVINKGKPIGFSEIFSIYRNENGEYVSQDLTRSERNERKVFGKYKEFSSAPENEIEIIYDDEDSSQIKEIKLTKKVAFVPISED